MNITRYQPEINTVSVDPNDSIQDPINRSEVLRLAPQLANDSNFLTLMEIQRENRERVRAILIP